MQDVSVLDRHRKAYSPKLPPALAQGADRVTLKAGAATEPVKDKEAIQAAFPKTYGMPVIEFSAGTASSGAAKALKVGVVLSGGQAPGGHNVIAGIFDAIRKIHKDSQVFGFSGGPSGLETGKYEIITDATMDVYRNTGGFDIIGSGRTKLETTEQFDRCIEVVKRLGLDAVVIIGGDDSNTNAAVLAEYFLAKGAGASVVGVPKTIDGDLKNAHIPTSFGFDTAVKTYSELIGNIARDARSARKYWHFIKLMGRSASHITLEAGLRTRANVTLISEEVEAKAMTLDQVVDLVAGPIKARAKQAKNYGVVLVPEGLIEFVPALKALVAEVNHLLAEREAEFSKLEGAAAKISTLAGWLKPDVAATFKSLPASIQAQLLLDRDPHGNVQVSLIETEKLLSEMVAAKLKGDADYKAAGGKFSAQHHFFGYEGRAAAPSNFDADYCYGLGAVAAVLINNGKTGYMASIRNLSKGPANWVAGGIPITMLFNMEQRHGKLKPVIQKALVELDGPAFKELAKHRDAWAVEDAYLFPGPIQYFGPAEVCDAVTMTLELEGG
ncbi:MAG TPA: diphosphate--fructose-6-phosphate 1-phosphotransferase [Fibrobacteria bacterium]|nr:diphosphate--fructose-6-phosphate 1-phosphotransferase [Fibrobacteria bacterium]